MPKKFTRHLFTDQDYVSVLKTMARAETGESQLLIEVKGTEHQLNLMRFPKFVFDFCAEHNLRLDDFVTCLLGAFVVEMESGISGREKYFFKKIKESVLPENIKDLVIKTIVKG